MDGFEVDRSITAHRTARPNRLSARRAAALLLEALEARLLLDGVLVPLPGVVPPGPPVPPVDGGGPGAIGTAPATVTLSASASAVPFGAAVTFTAIVSDANTADPAAVGYVVFRDTVTGQWIGAGMVTNGIATATESNLPVGSYSVGAQYMGDAVHAASSSDPLTLAISQASTTIALTTAPSQDGQGQLLTATVSGVALLPPTGTVTFLDDTTVLGTADLHWGTAYLPVTLSAGTHNLTAVYSGETNYTSSTSPVVPVTVSATPIVTTLSLSASATTANSGATLTFTAVLAAAGTDAQGNGPTGNIVFLDGRHVLGTQALDATGTAVLSTSLTGAGTHNIYAAFDPAPNYAFAASTAAPVAVTVQEQTVLALTVLGPGTPTDGPTLVATVTDAAATPLPDASAAANWQQPNQLQRAYGVVYVVPPSTPSTPSTTDNLVDPTAALAAADATTPSADSAAASLYGPPITGPGLAPTGTITFMEGTTVLGTATLLHGRAVFNPQNLALGDHVITAVYSGDANYITSTSAAVTATVEANSTTTQLFTTAPQVTATQPFALYFVVSTTLPDTVKPTGTVTIMDGTDTVLATANPGQRQTLHLTLSAGTHTLVAIYSGDANYPGSKSDPLTLTVVDSSATTTPTDPRQAYLQGLYRDLLHRQIDPVGQAAWTQWLASGKTYQDVATAIVGSREYQGNIIDGFYSTYLGRHAEASGLNAWVDLMQQGENADQIRAGILGSNEYFARTGGTNTSLVTSLYQTFLNRTPEATGLQAWTGLLAQGTSTRQVVSAAIANSPEGRQDLVTSYYQAFLHRSPDAPGLQAWMQNLASGVSEPAIVSAFVTAPEYLQDVGAA